MSQTYDTFAAGYTALQSLRLMDNATHFALWRKPELMARFDDWVAIEVLPTRLGTFGCFHRTDRACAVDHSMAACTKRVPFCSQSVN